MKEYRVPNETSEKTPAQLTSDVSELQERMHHLRELMLDEKGELILATKKDVAAVLEAFDAIVTAATIISKGSKFGFRVLGVISALFIGWGIVTGGFKGLIMWIVIWAQSR